EQLILGLLAKRPEDRPRSGMVVAEDLRQEIERIRLRERQGAPATGPTGAQAQSLILGSKAPPTEAQSVTATGPDLAAATGAGVGSRASASAPPSSTTTPSQQDHPAETLATQAAIPSLATVGAKLAPAQAVPEARPARRAYRAMASVAGTGGVTALVR